MYYVYQQRFDPNLDAVASKKTPTLKLDQVVQYPEASKCPHGRMEVARGQETTWPLEQSPWAGQKCSRCT